MARVALRTLSEAPSALRTVRESMWLVGPRLRCLDLCPRFRFPERNVPGCIDLDLLRFCLPDRRLLVGGRLGHTSVSRHSGYALLAEQFDVVRLVGEALDREGIDLQAARGEVALGRVLHLLEQLLPVTDQLFDGQRAND